MPDLNYENPAVTSAMDDVARYWLTDMGADGFRLDALQHIVEEGTKQANTDATHVWANAFHQYVDSVKPDALTVGEVDDNSFLSAPYVPEGADLVFDFDLAERDDARAPIRAAAAAVDLAAKARQWICIRPASMPPS